MRIIQVVHDFLPKNIGGVEIYTYNLSRQLSKKHDVYLFFSEPEKKAIHFVRKGFYNGLPYTAVNPLYWEGFSSKLVNLFKPGGFFTFIDERIDKAFEDLIDEFQPDVIHFQHLIGLSANLVNLAYQAGIPLVFTTHDYWLLCPQAHLIDTKGNICPLKDKNFDCLSCFWAGHGYQSKNLLNLLSLPYCAYFIYYLRPKTFKDIIKKIDLFLVPSFHLYNQLVKYGFPKEKIIHHTYGIDTAKFRGISKIKPKHLRFAFIGPAVPAKGINVLVKAFNTIKDGTLDIYGPLPGDSRNRLKNLIKNKNIKIKGKFAHKKIGVIFSKIDVLVVPSICMENSPLIVREAFASQTSVIASDIGGLRELVEDRKSGLLFKLKDVKDLRQKIQYFIDNPQEIKGMSKNIKPLKTIEEEAGEIEKIYRELIKRNKGR